MAAQQDSASIHANTFHQQFEESITTYVGALKVLDHFPNQDAGPARDRLFHADE
jgi:hypothetical protein